MPLHLVDGVAIVLYFLFCIFIGIRLGGSPKDSKAYFLSDGSIPWWIIAFSIVATETSMLTVISTPAIAYGGNLTFLQLGMGYVAGRYFVAHLILPYYFSSDRSSTYAYVGERFGTTFRRLMGLVFLLTRLLADGVRLFAAAIPIKLITGLDYGLSIILIAILTLAYAYLGGIKSVIWIDALQLGLYVFAGLFIISWVLFQQDFSSVFGHISSDKLTVFDFSHSNLLNQAYHFPTAFFGGAVLSIASHGTDHLIVQRSLATGNIRDAKKSMIASGYLVLFQFTLFLIVGLALFSFYSGASVSSLGLGRADEILPHFVLAQLPMGIKGLIIAGLMAAAMSTLSSSLTALSSSTLLDLLPGKLSELSIHKSRWTMLFWTVLFCFFAASFSSMDNPVIELGLGIAGFTYGGLLGAFLMARFSNIDSFSAIFGLFVSVILMAFLILSTSLAWPWYTLCGTLIFGSASYIAFHVRQFL